MKKIITAINNPKLNEELKKEGNFKIIGKDIQYKEAILEILEKNQDIDLIILSEKILGEIKLEKLIKKIRMKNDKIKIIFILEKENNEIEKILLQNNIIDIYYNHKITLKELIKIINKKEINMEEEILKLKKIIEEKNIKYNEIEKNKNKINNKYLNEIKYKIKIKLEKIIKNKKKYNNLEEIKTKIITFSGNYKTGKSTISLIISQYLSMKNYKTLLIDGDLEKQDLSFIIKKNKKNFYNKNNFHKNIIIKIKNNFYLKKLINKKNTIYFYQIKKIINLSKNKINKNLYFFNKLKNILNNLKYKKILFVFFKIIKTQYQFIIIDLSKSNDNKINRQILKNSDINFVLTEANLLGVKELQKILKLYLKEWKINQNSLHIISNKKNISSINKNLISKSSPLKNKIFEIKENKIYYNVTNNYFKIKFLLKNKKIKQNINKIINYIILK